MSMLMSRQGLPPTPELFERYAATVYRRCLAILGEVAWAEDATQEVFLKVIEKRHEFRGESSARTWLYGIATLWSLQQLRNRKRHAIKLATVAAFAESRPVALWGPEDRLAVAQILEGVDDAVALTACLRFVDGMQLDEVAAALGCSRRAVSKRLKKFAEVARARLAADPGEEVGP